MRHTKRWAIALLILIACLAAVAIARLPNQPASNEAATSADQPAKVEQIKGEDASRVILSAQAAERLGIQTAPIRDTQVNGTLRKVAPNSAVFYDLNGATWVYTSPESLTFVRAPIVVAAIDGDVAILSEGPPSGTMVVVVGAPELFGAETGVGE